MVAVALCYGELAARFPSAGGEFLYTLETFGRGPAFIVAWFLTLYSVAVCAFEAIVCGWLVRALIPTLDFGTAYTIAGSPVSWDALLIGGGVCLGIGALHYRGARAAIGYQNVVTFGFLVVSVALIVWGGWWGKLRNLDPLWATASQTSWVTGAFWIFSTCAFFLNGWQTALHAIEERNTNVTARGAVLSIVVAITAAALFYTCLILSAASIMPWRSLIGTELPAVAAFSAADLHGVLGPVALLAAIVSLTKTWSAMTWVASRVIFAQARLGFLPSALARIDSRSGAPGVAVVVVIVLTGLGLAMGRGAILPIVNMVAICLALSMIFCIVVLLRRRSVAATDAPSFVVPGGTPMIIAALVGAAAMVGVAVGQPLVEGRQQLPIEWLLLVAWAALGVAVWWVRRWIGRSPVD
jgi:basic amino acid/polyamine antiporter, APA family